MMILLMMMIMMMIIKIGLKILDLKIKIISWFESLRLHGVDLSSNMDANEDTFPLLPSCEKVAHSHY